MMELTISLIALALSIVTWALARRLIRKMADRNKELKEQVKKLSEALMRKDEILADVISSAAECTPERITYVAKDSFSTAVVVLKKAGGKECVVKLFTDDDYEYNRMCAEELVEKLNER